MIIAISTGFGIQNEIKSKFSNVFGDLSIDRYDNDLYNSENYIESDAIKVNSIKSMENLKSIDPVIYSPVISPNNNSFDDIILKGINEDNYIFKTKLLSNKINNIGLNEVIISKKLSKKLELQLKDNLMVFYYQNQSLPKIRNLKVIGFYETGISEFDSKVVLTNINQLRSLKNINNNQILEGLTSFGELIQPSGKCWSIEKSMYAQNISDPKFYDKKHLLGIQIKLKN